MAAKTRHIGLSLGADICWPICYEALLKKLDLTDTLIIYTSDHGQRFADGRKYGHGQTGRHSQPAPDARAASSMSAPTWTNTPFRTFTPVVFPCNITTRINAQMLP